MRKTPFVFCVSHTKEHCKASTKNCGQNASCLPSANYETFHFMWRSKKFYGLTLCALDGEIGKVDDLYFDDLKKNVRYIVARTGPWLFARKVLLSPLAIDEIDMGKKQISINLTRKQVQESPDIDTDQPVSRQMEVLYHDYYSWPYYWEDPSYSALYSPADLLLYPNNKSTTQKRGDPHLWSAKETFGYDIDASDKKFGVVRDFLIDENWRLRHVVVNTKKLWNTQIVLVPVELMDFISYAERGIRFHATELQIQNAPPYNFSELDNAFEDRVLEHYGLRHQNLAS